MPSRHLLRAVASLCKVILRNADPSRASKGNGEYPTEADACQTSRRNKLLLLEYYVKLIPEAGGQCM